MRAVVPAGATDGDIRKKGGGAEVRAGPTSRTKGMREGAGKGLGGDRRALMMGTNSEVCGSCSATESISTEKDSITVMPSIIFSPLSAQCTHKNTTHI